MYKNQPLVSVVINCLNGEKYLRQCIKSVINQSYKNWELVFWDNCSTDNSIKIIKSFKDKRIKLYKSKSLKNLYQARNLALNKCNGKYICFLDVDDMWLKNKLELQVTEMKKDKFVKILYTNYIVLINEKKKNL